MPKSPVIYSLQEELEELSVTPRHGELGHPNQNLHLPCAFQTKLLLALSSPLCSATL